ncbi:hypothetical protein [Undibacterium sp.]|uniref:hypothetical protein n=1 Tax=Undibacterium sp. TaxID=1914977 RepID=UPI0037529585
MKTFLKTLIATSLLIGSLAQAQSVPKHLQLARDFAANIKIENNDYTNTKPFTLMPGDAKYDGKWVVDSDCSAFVADMLDRAYPDLLSGLTTRKFRTRYSLFDLLGSIEREEIFKQVKTVGELMPGDVVMWIHPKKDSSGDTGHVVFVDSLPKKVAGRKPFKFTLDQYEIRVVDVSQEAKSEDDPRFVTDRSERAANLAKGKQRGNAASSSRRGIGTGSIRLYVDKAGALQGVAFNTPGADLKEPDNEYRLYMARANLKN